MACAALVACTATRSRRCAAEAASSLASTTRAAHCLRRAARRRDFARRFASSTTLRRHPRATLSCTAALARTRSPSARRLLSSRLAASRRSRRSAERTHSPRLRCRNPETKRKQNPQTPTPNPQSPNPSKNKMKNKTPKKTRSEPPKPERFIQQGTQQGETEIPPSFLSFSLLSHPTTSRGPPGEEKRGENLANYPRDLGPGRLSGTASLPRGPRQASPTSYPALEESVGLAHHTRRRHWLGLAATPFHLHHQCGGSSYVWCGLIPRWWL